MKAPLVETFYSELIFSFSRSSGPGGQNVNKVNSKVSLQWHVAESQMISDDQKMNIIRALAAHITKDGYLQLTSQEARSQLANKELVTKKLQLLLTKAFAEKKARKATKPTKAAQQKRILQKKQHGEKKKWRQKGEG